MGISQPASQSFRKALTAKPRLLPYERLSEVYSDYSRGLSLRYRTYLPTILDATSSQPDRHILDLACGTGMLTFNLAQTYHSVVGMDANENMLQIARLKCDGISNVRLVLADFRTFCLEERFHAVLCCADSLNYVTSIEEFQRVFANVATHLASGGVFLFDVLDERAMIADTKADHFYQVGDVRFCMCSEYDPQSRRSTTHVVFREGVEDHVRIPIEQGNVYRAAANSNLRIRDTFLDDSGFRRFFILQN